MRTTFARAAASAALFLAALAAPFAASATVVGAGDLVKLQDDGNLATTADSAVYYVGGDGKRYVFPNSQTYFTWYKDFATVKIVAPDELAALPIGGNVTYRPGTRLVKITSDPNVYAVEPGGELRWVQNETIAKTLFGDQWNKRIDDVPDAYFFNYTIGSPLAAAIYPDGTIVKRSSDGAYFRIEDRNKRRIPSADVLAALRVQDAFVLTTTGDLSDYPDAADITSAEPTINDTSQKTTTNLPSVPTFSLRNPATNFIAIGGGATFLEIHLATLKAMSLQKITVKIDATTDGDPGEDLASRQVDGDKGGLVYGNNAQRNLTGVRILDAAGNEVFGRKDAALDVTQDQSQTFVFTGSKQVPGGQDTKFYLVADTNPLLPTGEGYKATLVVAGTSLSDATTGAATAFLPQSDLTGPTLGTLASALQVGVSSTPGSKTYVRGTTAAMLGGFTFKATTVAPNVIKSLAVQCYVSDTTAGALVPATGSKGTPCKNVIPQLALYDANGVKVGGPVAVTIEGKASFTGLNYSVLAGQTATLQVGGDLSGSIDLSGGPVYLSFDVTDASTDVGVVDDKSAKVAVAGKLPNGGSSAQYEETVKQRGRVGWSWNGASATAVAGRETLLGTLTADVHDDAFTLKTVTFTQAAGAAKSLGDVRIEYPIGQGTETASVTKSLVGADAVFSGISIPLPKDSRTDIKLYGKLFPRDGGAKNGEVIKMSFAPSGALQFVSKTDASSFSGTDLAQDGDFTVVINATSTITVRFTDLAAEKTSDSPSGNVNREHSEAVFTFDLKTGAEGAARIKKLAFKLIPGDAGQANGAQNDALEGWANLNGDFADDDGIANLKQLGSGSNSTLIGEGPGASIRYSVVSGATTDTAPSARQSAQGDYGVLEYVFDEGNEFSLAAGTTTKFSLELDTTTFAAGKDWPLTIELQGGDQFQWTDITSGAYSPLSGSDVVGLPTSNAVTVLK